MYEVDILLSNLTLKSDEEAGVALAEISHILYHCGTTSGFLYGEGLTLFSMCVRVFGGSAELP